MLVKKPQGGVIRVMRTSRARLEPAMLIVQKWTLHLLIYCPVELISSITKVLSGSDECKGYRATQHDESVFSSVQL